MNTTTAKLTLPGGRRIHALITQTEMGRGVGGKYFVRVINTKAGSIALCPRRIPASKALVCGG